MSDREQIQKIYGEHTLRALDDFIQHSCDAALAIKKRHPDNEWQDNFAAEAIMVHLGESARRAGERFIDDHPELDFQGIISMRNLVAHGYDIVDHEEIWHQFNTVLPETARHVKELLDPQKRVRRHLPGAVVAGGLTPKLSMNAKLGVDYP